MKRFIALLLMATLVLSSSGQKAVVAKEEAFDDSFNLQIANEDRLVEMLMESGQIEKGASMSEIQEVVAEYVSNKEKMYSEKGELADKEERRADILTDMVKEFRLEQGNGKKVGKQVRDIESVSPDTYDGEVTEDRILAVLINFPDYDGSTLTEEHTDLVYDEYLKEHYEDLLFGESYEGPDGESFVSMKSFYEEQSGGSYIISGGVAGWYTAKNNAAYYGANDDMYNNDMAPRELVMEALDAVVQDPTIDLNYYDQEDRYDLDGDGNFREPDGLIDHLMIFHASVGEEAGGGELGDDAIWSHSWNLGGVYGLPVATDVPYWGGIMAAYDYTIQPIDAAAGVCAHEYGHDLGLPDEYDTSGQSLGEPVSYWSIMASGSWAGEIPGTEPTGFSPYAKEFFAGTINSRWFEAAVIDFEELNEPAAFYLDEASTKGENLDALRINIPNKVVQVIDMLDDNGHYYSESGNNLDNYMYTGLDLTGATTANLTFKTNYQIEADFDYGYVFVIDESNNWTSIEGNITTSEDPNAVNFGNGITGSSNGWIDAEFDLSAFAGQSIILVFEYITDAYVSEYGWAIDQIQVTADDQVILEDNDQSMFSPAGFATDSDGTTESARYYLIEWRNHSGVDAGLGNIKRGDSLMSYDPGMVVWFVDEGYEENHVASHYGEGYVGVVDASQHVLKWPGNDVASTKYQIHDAAFNVSKSSKMKLDYRAYYDNKMVLTDNNVAPNPVFDDSNLYINGLIPDAGKILPEYGLKIRVLGESDDQSVGLIQVYQ